jgi:hypothetical protein
MKKIKLLLSCTLISMQGAWGQGDTLFDSDKTLNLYRFGNTNLQTATSGYLLDYLDELTPLKMDSTILFYNKTEQSMNSILGMFSILESTKVDFTFEKDSVLFPIINQFYSYTGTNNFDIPIFIFNNNFSRLDNTSRGTTDNWASTNPYPSFANSDFSNQSIKMSTIFMDTLEKVNLRLYWSDNTFFCNTGLQVTAVKWIRGLDTIEIFKDQYLDLNFYNAIDPIQSVNLLVTFSDGSTKYNENPCYLSQKSQNKDNSECNYPLVEFPYVNSFSGEGVRLEVNVRYSCENNDLPKRPIKPLILVRGFGPYTNSPEINILQNWPVCLRKFYNKVNVLNIFEEMHQEGFDIYIFSFFPPNASAIINANRIEEAINWINANKVENEAKEENVIISYSAGAIAARLALLQMEKKVINQNAPHPHTKLYVSYDGEHGGANIPLGVQHAVEYINSAVTGLSSITAYALHYLLNVSLSQELLYHFHTGTGSPSSPNQGRSSQRSNLLQQIAFKNHVYSSYGYDHGVPDYPSFMRRVSISNGSHNANNPYPFPAGQGQTIYQQNNPLRTWKINLGAVSSNHTVFKYRKYVGLFTGWQTQIERSTNSNYRHFDNAPGGSIEYESNPIWSCLSAFQDAFPFYAQIAEKNTLFSFTPTVLTHDIRNYNASVQNYDMKAQGLMYQSLNQIVNVQPPSKFYGYPHLAHPSDHYSSYTPFDAVFSWDQNTEHISTYAARIDPDAPNNKTFWTRDEPNSSDVLGQVESFLKNELDVNNVFVQNRKFGLYANTSNPYSAKIRSKYSIFAGQNVTQRTDFKPVEVNYGAHVVFEAAQQITLSPGFQVFAGSKFHAFIQEPFYCAGKSLLSNGSSNEGEQQEALNLEETREKASALSVYPNPSNGIVTVKLPNNESALFYSIYTINGVFVKQEAFEKANQFQLTLPQGIFILKVTNHENKSYTHKLIVQ